MIGIRKSLKVERIEEWEFGLTIKGLEIGGNKRADLIIVYNNGKIEIALNKLSKMAEESIEQGNALLIAGDFNARIAEWQIGQEGEREKTRNSYDKVLNREGEKLLEFCEELGGTIKNGATKGDWEGKATFVGEGCQSVLDLVVEVESEIGSIVEEVKIVPRIESDHLPVEFILENDWEIGIESEWEKGGNRREEARLVWDGKKRQQYSELMEEKLLEKGSQEKGGQERWEELVRKIKETARELKMLKESVGRGEKRWQDKEIREQKRKTWEALKKMVKYKRGRGENSIER